MARYKDWLDSIDHNLVSPANPVKNTTTINPDGSVTEGGDSGMSGYTIIEAPSKVAALVITTLCPFLGIGGALAWIIHGVAGISGRDLVSQGILCLHQIVCLIFAKEKIRCGIKRSSEMLSIP